MQAMTWNSRAARVAALFFVFAALLLAVSAPSVQARERTDTAVLVTAGGERTIAIEVAETEADKALGLMFRTKLADDRGMLFVYDEEREITMWMSNTYIPLDMVFIGKDGKVLRIEANAEPLSERLISSGSLAIAVLELAGGAAARHGLKPGDQIRSPALGRVIKN